MLQGARVTLRPLMPADYSRLLDFKNDVALEQLAGSTPPRPMNIAELAERFDAYAKDPLQCVFAIEVNGKFAGDCGLYNRNLIDGTCSLGIGIGAPNLRGRGYGRETMHLLVEYGFQVQNIRKINLQVLADNERAVRCYRAVGFLEEGRFREHAWVDGRYADVLAMALLRSDWSAD